MLFIDNTNYQCCTKIHLQEHHIHEDCKIQKEPEALISDYPFTVKEKQKQEFELKKNHS